MLAWAGRVEGIGVVQRSNTVAWLARRSRWGVSPWLLP
jgi:hypothetical protein